MCKKKKEREYKQYQTTDEKQILTANFQSLRWIMNVVKELYFVFFQIR